MQRVIVVGGGLAGLAAAAELSSRGMAVDLFESRPRLGGRASSFHDVATGERIDTCQHVSLGCCTNLSCFADDLQISDYFKNQDKLYFFDPEGRLSILSSSWWLPAPLHLMPSFLTSRVLGLRDKWSVARGLQALCMREWNVLPRRLKTPLDHKEKPQSFLDWLKQRGQTDAAIERFWSVILTSALSESLDHIDIDHARKVFRDAFFVNRNAWIMSVPSIPLGELYGERILETLQKRGVCVHLNQAVERINVSSETVQSVVLKNGTTVDADWFVLTVPPRRVLSLIPPAVRQQESYFDVLENFTVSPITSVHFWFDRSITSLPHAVIVGRTSQWIFNRCELEEKTKISNDDNIQGGRETSCHSGKQNSFYYQVVISASHELAQFGKDKIIEQVQCDLKELFPESREARCLHARVITEHAAVFSVSPGIESLRPSQKGPLTNLFLAGDWTDTGWPATMEGAVRSGYLAAEKMLKSLGEPVHLIRPDLPCSRLSRLLLQ